MHFFKRAAMICMVIAVLATSALSLNLNASALNGAGAPSATNPEMILGIDLSYWNVSQNSLIYSQVNFEELKADGVKFVILRLGYETSTTSGIKIDPAFNEFYKRARAAGLDLGLYLYSYAMTYNAAKNDALEVIEYIEARDMYFEYPIYLDMETEAQTSASSSTMTNICLGWCEILEERGYYPAIYSAYWVYNSLPSSFKSRYDFWVPAYKSTTYNASQYTYTSQPSVLGGKPYANGYCMWQYSCCNYYNGNYVYKGVYTASGGRNTSLDLNVCYKDYPTIMKTYGYNNCAPAESASKTRLRNIISETYNVKHNDYSVNALEEVRLAEWNGTTVLNAEGSTDAQFDEAYNRIVAALNNKTVALSKGKSYTATPNTRTGAYGDDGIRLTDGIKGHFDGGALSDGSSIGHYAGFNDKVEVVVDLGSVQSSDTYTAYFAAGMWGIHLPRKNLLSLEVQISNNATSGFTSIGSTNDLVLVGGSNVADDDWTTFTATVNTSSANSARYVKFIITNNECKGDIWIDEVEATLGGGSIVGGAYISGMNAKILSGDCHMFTPAFGTITTTAANHAYTLNVIAKYNATYDRFVVTQISEGIGPDTASVTLADDEILIACHCWEGDGITDPVVGSKTNFEIVSRAKVGDIIEFSGINIPYAFTTAGAHISFHGATEIPDNGDPYHVEGEWETLPDGSQVLKCTKCGEILDTKEAEDPTVVGDVNLDGKVNMFDYMIVKSYYLGKSELTDEQFGRADVNADGKVNMFDYLIIKNMCF